MLEIKLAASWVLVMDPSLTKENTGTGLRCLRNHGTPGSQLQKEAYLHWSLGLKEVRCNFGPQLEAHAATSGMLVGLGICHSLGAKEAK